MDTLKDKNILLGISGGIAAYKSAYLCRRLIEAGCHVRVVMTASATNFITPLTMESLSGRDVITEMFPKDTFVGTRHIDIAGWADLFIIAPATANLIGRYAAGLADDMMATLLIATRAPVLVAPAMNTDMYLHPAVQSNLDILRKRGVLFVEPGVGDMACRTVGVGRMAEPEDIVARAAVILSARDKRDLLGQRVLVTAGPTREPIDPVRVITNRSSGRMGYAIAEAAILRGASVVLVSGPTALPQPSGVEFVAVETAEQMRDAVLPHFATASMAIGVAAVSDWQLSQPSRHKLRKDEGPPRLEFVPTPDILMELSVRKKPGQILVGFALETDPDRVDSNDKLQRKNLDVLVVNNPVNPGSEFGGDSNEAVLLSRHGDPIYTGLIKKRELADLILDTALAQHSTSTANST